MANLNLDQDVANGQRKILWSYCGQILQILFDLTNCIIESLQFSYYINPSAVNKEEHEEGSFLIRGVSKGQGGTCPRRHDFKKEIIAKYFVTCAQKLSL